ncbi:hypothetical protein D0Y65_042257 [Glycine soja]|uniref:Uncharacterized protein n=1 Tax=Glycine soja TaxID=3848 RepID=A0A445GCE8_GLYSO|nr:hypothetical protein D0Y65_042257 [Glycine soja]
MVTAGTKKPQVSVPTPPPPPWKINLQKYAESRALELHSLQSIIENRVNSDYRSQKNKRRRTTVFDNQIARKGCRRKRQKLGIIDKALAKSGLEENHQKKLPRCVHRRYELKKNPENGFCTSGDVTKRLRTHDSLMSVLRMVLEPYPATTPHPGNHDDSVLYSVTYGRAMVDVLLLTPDPRELPWKKTVVLVESISTKTPSDAEEKKYKEVAELGGILEENRDLSSLSRSKLVDSQFDIDGSMDWGWRMGVGGWGWGLGYRDWGLGIRVWGLGFVGVY